MEAPQKNQPNPNNSKKALATKLLLEAATEFAVIIGLPLYGFIKLGKYLDSRYDQRFFTILGILLALFISGYAIYKRIITIKKLLK